MRHEEEAGLVLIFSCCRKRPASSSFARAVGAWHNDSFWKKAVAKKKFCVVDSRKALEDDGWVDFMTSMLQ